MAEAIEERRYWLGGRWRYCMLFPLGLCVVGFTASWNSKNDLLAGTPMLGMLAYGCMLMIWGRSDVKVDRRGFQVKPGPLPTGMRMERHTKEEVKHLFPRHLRESEGKNNWVDNYYAAVELHDGRWLNLRGPYRDWGAALFACKEVAAYWRFPLIDAGRSGFPAGYRNLHGGMLVALWGAAFILALLWGAWVEYSGWGR